MVRETPPDIVCTTFSILFARLKGDMPLLAGGAGAIRFLKPGRPGLYRRSLYAPFERG